VYSLGACHFWQAPRLFTTPALRDGLFFNPGGPLETALDMCVEEYGTEDPVQMLQMTR